MAQCHSCGREWVTQKRVRVPGVKETCEGCGGYLHCCMNCRFHDPSAHNQCVIPKTEWVADRAKANFCDQFEWRRLASEGAQAEAGGDARQALDALFGDDAGPVREEGRTNLDSLFGD
jgi:hypothetical protein